jgi:cation diffusion facilitator CzcD-associated flavoprotein CzcO
MRQESSRGREWLVEYTADGVSHVELFDAVCVCNGHYNEPFCPYIPGLEVRLFSSNSTLVQDNR